MPGGALYVAGDILGEGAITLGADLLQIDGAVSAGQAVIFAANVASLLELGEADRFHGTAAGMSGNDSIALQDFDFADTRITGVSGTAAARTYTSVTLSDGAQNATFAPYNQHASQFAVDAGAYTLRAEPEGATTGGTLFALAPPVV